MNQLTDDQARAKVWQLIQDILVAQLVTFTTQNGLVSRPMSAMNKEFNGTLWFYTDVNASMIGEIQSNGEILLTYSKPGQNDYVSLRGRALVLNDRAQINLLWNEMARIWFPQGSDDPNLRLIRVDVLSAEYWDSPSNMFHIAYDYVAAYITGQVPETVESRKVAF